MSYHFIFKLPVKRVPKHINSNSVPINYLCIYVCFSQYTIIAQASSYYIFP